MSKKGENMFDTIISAFTGGTATGIFGILSGLVGGITTAVTNYKMKKLDMEEKKQKRIHAQAMKELDIKLIAAEADANVQIAREQTAGILAKLEGEAYKASQECFDKPLFYQDYMQYLMEVAKSKKWYSFLAGFTIYLITISFALIDCLKQGARPILTYYTMALATYITVIAYHISSRAGVSISADQAFQILMLSVHTVLYLAVTSFAWWFCDRQASKFIATKLGWNVTK
jgi:hypothetical protein